MNRKAWVYAAAFMNLNAFNFCYIFRALRQEAEYWFSGAKQLHLGFLPQYTWILGWHNCLSSPLSPSPQRKLCGFPCYDFWALAVVLGHSAAKNWPSYGGTSKPCFIPFTYTREFWILQYWGIVLEDNKQGNWNRVCNQNALFALLRLKCAIL